MKAVVICLLLTSAQIYAANEKKTITVRALANTSHVNEQTRTVTAPGSSNTNCSGTGINTGPVSTASVNCQTSSTPSVSRNITTRTVDVVNIVQGDGRRFTIRCSATWSGSNCSTLREGDEFTAEIDGKTMWITARKNGNQGKEVRMRNLILDIRTADTTQEVAAAPPRPHPATESEIAAALASAAARYPDFGAYEQRMTAIATMFPAGNVSPEDYVEGLYVMAKYAHFLPLAPRP